MDTSKKVRLPKDVRGDYPFGHLTVAPAGIYDAHENQFGAVCVIATDGSMLGVKPDEFEWEAEASRPVEKETTVQKENR